MNKKIDKRYNNFRKIKQYRMERIIFMNSYWEEERKNHDLFEEIKEDKKVSVCIIV